MLGAALCAGAMVQPRTRNSIDWSVGVNTQRCSNITGDECHNGQAAFWYSQGCFIGCPTCDNASGRRQVDLCGLGKKQTLINPKYWSVNRDALPFSELDIYQHNPWYAEFCAVVNVRLTLCSSGIRRAPGSAPVADAW